MVRENKLRNFTELTVQWWIFIYLYPWQTATSTPTITAQKHTQQGRASIFTARTMRDMSLSKLQELVMDREAGHAAVQRAAKPQTRPSDWTELKATP